MKKIVEIYQSDLSISEVYMGNMYPHSGVFETPHDTLSYICVDKPNNFTIPIPKECMPSNVEPEPEKQPDIGHITVDEALRLIAVAKDSRLIEKVVVNPNKI